MLLISIQMKVNQKKNLVIFSEQFLDWFKLLAKSKNPQQSISTKTTLEWYLWAHTARFIQIKYTYDRLIESERKKTHTRTTDTIIVITFFLYKFKIIYSSWNVIHSFHRSIVCVWFFFCWFSHSLLTIVCLFYFISRAHSLSVYICVVTGN